MESKSATNAPLRILIVDDDHDTVDSLCLVLRAWGYDALCAYDGGTASALALQERPDVVIADLAMPGVDGRALARQVRGEPSLANTVLICLSGYGQAKDRQLALAAGFDHHFVKPTPLDALQALLQSCRGVPKTP
ncbi:MAG TPA: response regulator [Gemmataceae bacterium]|nr:response regulator [Gemmataceae bacterium]